MLRPEPKCNVQTGGGWSAARTGEKLSGRVIGQEASTAGEAGLGRRWGSCVPTAGRGGGLSCQVQQRVVGSGHLDAPPTLSETGAKGVCGLVTKVA